MSEASSAAPDGGRSGRASKPDNSGGASWFVLLAAEKNEQIEILCIPVREYRGSAVGEGVLDSPSVFP